MDIGDKKVGLMLVSVSLVFTAFQAWLLTYVNQEVPEPYMDEPFHARQTETFCKNKDWLDVVLNKWDPKLTTFPGLFATSALLNLCSLEPMRYVNGFLSIGMIGVWTYLLGDRVHKGLVWRLYSILLLPTHFFYVFLFYTDPGSLFFFSCMLYSSIKHGNRIRGGVGPVNEWHVWSGLFSTLAVLYRQTNIVWVGVLCGIQVVLLFREKTSSLNVSTFLRLVVSNFVFLLKHFFLHVCLIVLFAKFVYSNNGIVLGDKSNHKPCLHIVQLFYFSVFACVFEFPVLLDDLIWAFRSSYCCLPKVATLLQLFFSVVTVHFFTYEHEFLLADNRHYTFYVWKYFFQSHKLAKYMWCPLYVVCIKALHRALKRNVSDYGELCMIAVGITLTLVPSPLIEVRYFTVPFALLHYYLSPNIISRSCAVRHAILIFAEAAISFVVFYVYLKRPFVGPDGSESRFMY